MATRKRKISVKGKNDTKNCDNQLAKTAGIGFGWGKDSERDIESDWGTDLDENEKDFNGFQNQRLQSDFDDETEREMEMDDEDETEREGEDEVGGDGARFAKWLGNAIYKQITNLMSFKQKDDSDEEQIYENQSQYLDEPPRMRRHYKDSDKLNRKTTKIHDLEKSEACLSCTSMDANLEKYVKSGMGHVAAYIVQSAIRFGQEQGVVVADKEDENLYRLRMPVKSQCASRSKSILFHVPENVFGYEDAKKAMWRSTDRRNNNCCHSVPRSLHHQKDISEISIVKEQNSEESMGPVLELDSEFSDPNLTKDKGKKREKTTLLLHQSEDACMIPKTPKAGMSRKGPPKTPFKFEDKIIEEFLEPKSKVRKCDDFYNFSNSKKKHGRGQNYK